MPKTKSNKNMLDPVDADVYQQKIEELATLELDFEGIEAKYGEDVAIDVGIARDPDCPELTAEDFAQMRPAIEVCPEIVMAYRRGELRIRPDSLARRENGSTEADDKQEEWT